MLLPVHRVVRDVSLLRFGAADAVYIHLFFNVGTQMLWIFTEIATLNLMFN